MYYLSLFDKIIIKIHTWCTCPYFPDVWHSLTCQNQKINYLAKFIVNVNLIYRVNILGLNIKNLTLSLILEFVKYYADQIKLRLYWDFRLYWIRLYWNFQSIVSNTFSAGTRGLSDKS